MLEVSELEIWINPDVEELQARKLFNLANMVLHKVVTVYLLITEIN